MVRLEDGVIVVFVFVPSFRFRPFQSDSRSREKRPPVFACCPGAGVAVCVSWTVAVKAVTPAEDYAAAIRSDNTTSDAAEGAGKAPDPPVSLFGPFRLHKRCIVYPRLDHVAYPPPA